MNKAQRPGEGTIYFQENRLMKISYRKISLLVIVNLMLFSGSQSVFAGDYLSELASEAESTASVSSRGKLSTTERKQFEAMEQLLKDEKPSTFKYYVKLNKKQKRKAFETYAVDKSDQDKRMHHLQKKVMDLYFSQ